MRYAGRYARRPPIAQRRITSIRSKEITFLAKDRKLCRQVTVRLTPAEFLASWMQHIPDDYEHAVRSFGLFAPRAIRTSAAAVFTTLGQTRKPRPRPLSWSLSIKRDFGWNGFYTLAQSLGFKFSDREAFWIAEFNRVTEYWRRNYRNAS